MKPPLFVRPLTDTDTQALTTGLHSADAFTLRRCQIILASDRGQRPSQIAQVIGCSPQTVRATLHAFERDGAAALTRRSSRPRTTHPAFDDTAAERLRELLQRSPRAFGKDTSLWTLALVAEVSYSQGITPQQVSGETVRATLERLGIGWQRAKRWITSPDPAYARKKGSATV